jgi:hypothetical protein
MPDRNAKKRVSVAAESMAVFGPYQLFAADLYACPACNKEVLAGFPVRPLANHHESTYALEVQAQSRGGHYQFWRNVQEKEEYKTQHPLEVNQS